MNEYPTYGRLDGPVVMIGFGSIGRGTLPLILRHFDVEAADIVVVAPDTDNDGLLDQLGVRKVTAAVTADNYRELLIRTAAQRPGRPFCVNLSVDTSSVAILVAVPPTRRALRRHRDRTVAGFLRRPRGPARSPHQLRLAPDPAGRAGRPSRWADRGVGLRGQPRHGVVVRQAGAARRGGQGRSRPFGADQPGRVGGTDASQRGDRHPHRRARHAAGRRPKPIGTFVNTWSVDGFISEGLQPSEIGWGTHERWLPPSACHHADPDAPSIFLARPGADTRVRTWCPTAGPQYGLCVTHNESISIADYFTVRDGASVIYRPTCHYAYHPADDAMLSWHELLGSAGKPPAAASSSR